MRTMMALLLCTLLSAGEAVSQAASPQPQSVSAIRAQLSSVPNNARLDVKLNDGRKLRGRLGLVSAESFVLRLSRSGVSADEAVAFPSVKSVRRSRSTAAKVGIGIAVGAAAFIAFMIWYSDNI